MRHHRSDLVGDSADGLGHAGHELAELDVGGGLDEELSEAISELHERESSRSAIWSVAMTIRLRNVPWPGQQQWPSWRHCGQSEPRGAEPWGGRRHPGKSSWPSTKPTPWGRCRSVQPAGRSICKLFATDGSGSFDGISTLGATADRVAVREAVFLAN